MQRAQRIAPPEYDAADIARRIVDVAVDKKASDVTLLDIGGVTTFAEFFVIATAGSERQINALARSIDEAVSQDGVQILHMEGEPSDGWVLLDYGQVIVHLFAPEQRAYYDLERHWRDAPTLLKIQ